MEIKTIIIDDEQPSRENLGAILGTYFPEICIAGTAGSLEEATSLIHEQHPQLLFLDVELGQHNGFQVLEQFQDPDFEVIFITAYDAYAVKAFRTVASDYLLKPIDIDELRSAIDRIKAKFDLRQLKAGVDKQSEKTPVLDKMKITTVDGTELIPFEQIMYLQSINYYTNIVLVNGREIITSRHLKDYETSLSGGPFYRVHNSFMINVNKIRSLVHADGGQVILSNGKPIKISRRRKESFVRFVNNLNGLSA